METPPPAAAEANAPPPAGSPPPFRDSLETRYELDTEMSVDAMLAAALDDLEADAAVVSPPNTVDRNRFRPLYEDLTPPPKEVSENSL